MKNFLVFAVFGVLLVLKNIKAEECQPVPEFFIESMQQCLATLSEEDQALYFKEEQLDKREFKCLHLCFLEKTGFFKDGDFSLETLREIIHEYVPTKELAEAEIAKDEDSMMKAKEKGGDSCDIAHEYIMIDRAKEMEEPVNSRIFCSDR